MQSSRPQATIASRRGKMSTGMIVIIAAVIIAGGVVVAGAKVMGGHKATAKESEQSKDAPGGAKGEQGAAGSHGEEKSDDAVVVDLGEFLVNLAGTGENRYLRAEVSIRVGGLPPANKKSEHGATQDNDLPSDDLAVAKDCVTTVLSSGVFQQLRTVAGRAKLKENVHKRLQEALPKYPVHEVLFTSFVMQ